jgi:Domain of unknown function (DUF4157)
MGRNAESTTAIKQDARSASVSGPAGPAVFRDSDVLTEMQNNAGNRAVLRALGRNSIQRKSNDDEVLPQSVPEQTLLADDETTELTAGQMKKSQFLAQLRQEVCATADEGLAPAGRDSQGCPFISNWFDFYAGKSASHVERALHRFAPETAGIATAAELIPVIAARVRRSVDRWAGTGEVTGVPDESMAAAEGSPEELGTGMDMFFKARSAGGRETTDAGEVTNQIGQGRSLDGDARSRMESVFHRRFPAVRVHTGAAAEAIADRLNARAFTVGDHVGFAKGEFQPGTPVGDALLAHELAHVTQQQGAEHQESGPSSVSLERDADVTAFGAVSSLWGSASGAARPSLRSGLGLQRCSGNRPAAAPLDIGRLPSMTPWELRNLPEENFAGATAAASGKAGPRLIDYARARRLAQAVLTFDIDAPRSQGREPSAEELTVLDRNISQLLDSNSIRSRLSNRPLPSRGGASSLTGKVWIASQQGFAAGRYRLEKLVSTIDQATADTEVRNMWQRYQIRAERDARVTPQERQIALFQVFAHEPRIPNGFYQAQEDTVYIPDFVNLRTTEGAYLARHETAHLLGGREATRSAFMRRFGAAWMEWWFPFEEGLAELVSIESLPAGQAPPPPPTLDLGGGASVQGERYDEYVVWARSMTADPGNKEIVLQAYFSGNVPERVFELFARARGIPLPAPPR